MSSSSPIAASLADYHVHRRLYMPLIVESLMHDLGKADQYQGMIVFRD